MVHNAQTETVRSRIDLGAQTTPTKYIFGTGAFIQHHEAGAIMYEDGVGAAPS